MEKLKSEPLPTTIKVSSTTHKELSELIQYKGETYDHIIQRLLSEHKRKTKI